MAIAFPKLPYDHRDLEPYISEETMVFHYSKHHKNYVDKCNELIKDTPYDHMKIEEIIMRTANKDGKEKKIFNNASQSWNHNFFWNCLTPQPKKQPAGSFHKNIETHFNNLESFVDKFSKSAEQIFGSGWNWLVKNHDDSLSIVSYPNAESPLAHGQIPLLVCDVWEHAYYLDYQNDRAAFLKNFWNVVDWDFIERNFERHKAFNFTESKQELLSH